MVGTGVKRTLCDAGYELRLRGKEIRKCEDNKWDKTATATTTTTTTTLSSPFANLFLRFIFIFIFILLFLSTQS